MVKWKRAVDGDGLETDSGGYYAMVINMGPPSLNHRNFKWAVLLGGKRVAGGMSFSQRGAKAAAEFEMTKTAGPPHPASARGR